MKPPLPFLLLAALFLPSAAPAQITLVRGVVGAGATNATGGALTLRGTVGQAVVGPVVGTGLANGQGFWYVVGIEGSTPPTLMLTLDVFLEGPFSSGTLNVALSSVLPETDPYLGTESVPAGFFTTDPIGQQAVDWVLVQLRSGNPATPPMQIEAQRAALLLADGSIADTDGASTIAFSGLAPGNYFIAVFHRNHLAAMTGNAVNFTGGAGAHDFTGGAAYGTNAQAALGGGSFALYAGDASANGQVQNDDKNMYWNAQAGQTGYKNADFNLNGQVQNDDKNVLWNLNVGRGTQVPPAN